MAFLPAASAILGGIGAGAQAIGTLESGVYQAQIARNNQQIANEQSTYALEAGQERASNQSLRNASEAGQLKTSMAANGVDINTGSAAKAEASQEESGRLDVETLLRDADLAAWGYKNQATNFGAQAQQDQTGAIYSAAGGLLAKAPTLAWKWGQQPATPVEDNTTNSWTTAKSAVFAG